MAESKVFKLVEGVDAELVGRAIEGFLRDKKKLITEGVKTPEGYFIQAKGEGGWKKVAGMDMATQVQIMQMDSMITVGVGEGKWSDKIGAGAARLILFAPLAVTTAIGVWGVWGQKKLPKEIFDFIEQFIMSGGKSVTASMSVNQSLKENQMTCPNCKAVVEKGLKFCPSCGKPMTNECPSCHRPVGIGVKFCPNCGNSMNVKKICSSCGQELSGDTKFCPNCGTSAETNMLNSGE